MTKYLRFINFLDHYYTAVKRLALLGSITLMCISCSPTKDKYLLYNSAQHDHAVDISKLEDENGIKYGVALFRTVFLNSPESINGGCNNNLKNIETKGFPPNLGVYAMNSEDTSKISVHRGISDLNSFKISNKHFDASFYNKDTKISLSQDMLEVKGSREIYFWTPWKNKLEDFIFKPDYYYGVTIMPEGKYYITSISNFNSSDPAKYFPQCLERPQDFEQRFSRGEEAPYFTIKAGEINYLGDLYWEEPIYLRGRGFIIRKRYKLNWWLCDKLDDARKYFEKYYHNSNVKITKSIIKCCDLIPK